MDPYEQSAEVLLSGASAIMLVAPKVPTAANAIETAYPHGPKEGLKNEEELSRLHDAFGGGFSSCQRGNFPDGSGSIETSRVIEEADGR